MYWRLGGIAGGTILVYPEFALGEGTKLHANVLSHEIGHILGLNHTIYPDCLMYPMIPVGDRRRYANETKHLCRAELAVLGRHYRLQKIGGETSHVAE